ncbi:heterokaryon incompatibility protein-domain-containing protein [Copromyces sp. CBS 386.78]|nr:heterokaryon incompatibility protein-domain-containing protein [Copromyces sp. CBS 386.78]
MEAIKTLFNKLQDTVTPHSSAIKLPDHDRISLLTVNDEPYHEEIDSNDSQNDTPQIQLTPQQLYSHLRLDPSVKSIRVLDIDPPLSRDLNGSLEGTLRVVHLSDFPAFTALSYTWGPYSSPAVDTIRCNSSCDIPITKNGHDALLALRRRHYSGTRCQEQTLPFTIWLDAVCINQADNTEKAGQIALMAEVYTWARTVWVWLGNGDERTARAVRGLKRAATLRVEPVGVPWIEEDMYAAAGRGGGPRSVAYYKVQLAKSMIWVFLRTYWGIPRAFLGICAIGRAKKQGGLIGSSGDIDCLLDREWIERVWTFQEIVLASNPVIVCGEEAIGWAQLQEGLDCLHWMRPSFAGGGNDRTSGLRHQIFMGWAMSKDFRNDGELDNWFNESMEKRSDVAQRWLDLFQVWRTVSRPTGWNGRAFRSVPKLTGPDLNGNSSRTGASAKNHFSVEEYEGQFNMRKMWNRVRLVILLIYVGPPALLFAFTVSFTLGFIFGPNDEKPAYFWKSAVAAHLLFFSVIPFLGHVNLAMGDPTIGTRARSDIHASSGLVAIIRVLRDRKAQEAHDKSFATHGVLERLGISVPRPDYKKPLGKVYHELYAELVKREPSYIALLSDVKGSVLPGAPSWVPDWGSNKLHWTRDDAIYSRIEDPSKRGGSCDLVRWNSETEIVVRGLFIGDLSYTSKPIGCEERVNNGLEPASWRGSLTAIDEWRRELVELYARQTPRCEYSSSSVSLTLCSSSDQSSPDTEWTEEDFRRWHKVLTAPGHDDASKHELIELALSEREFQSRRFTDYICRGFAGTVSLFVSDNGFVGKGPNGIEKGDEIYLIDGVGQPMILRKQGDSGKYRVVGPAFACQLNPLYVNSS